MLSIDFETEAIDGNPLINPPKPIGVAVKHDHNPAAYLPGTPNDLRAYLADAWLSDESLLFHNAPFDIAVAREWLGLPQPHWERVHDTTFLVYLENPHAPSLSLKPSAKRILGMGTDDQDELHDWILANVRGANKKNAGAFICKAPFPLVSKYAKMDVDMTWALFARLYPKVPRGAYDLERELQPYLVEATRHGVRCDTTTLEIATAHAEINLVEAERRIFGMLGQEFDISNGGQLADALDKAGKVKEWKYTRTGRRSTSRPNLMSSLDDPALLSVLSYAGAMQTCLTTFMRPWSLLAKDTSRLHPSWNQVRGEDYGTRTGRLSCNAPNLQNVPNEFGFAIPEGLAPIPKMRDYLLPEAGDRWFSRDFSGQEMRLLAHFENGDLLRAFQKDPDLDPHQMVKDLILNQTGLHLTRKVVKGIGFGLIYGMGVPGLAKQLGVAPGDAEMMVTAYHAALPGVSELQYQTQQRGKYKQLMSQAARCKKDLRKAEKKSTTATPAQVDLHKRRVDLHKRRLTAALRRLPPKDHITTAWGREYRVEPSKTEGARMRTFEYKLLNYLIQGSAADQTKRSLLRYFKDRPSGQTFLCTVHDEINISVPEGSGDNFLRHAMDDSDGLDVPMRSTLKIGTTWGNIA